ncbi:hypothetical protein TSOC_008720 [Tetrabaena socialis]|uniref:Uncharacterized protein n=1 Tax=Tetrabaena socialis TaxID=47790 RepID=A0A2J7ZXT4_9CHLO|nr:hypothetical protein TSOC_008720 [Tetrabaena socialis]|eukprot:PNH05065.1 hypothetical protein TSOC_008720 [Tetrabaena socialis]
MLVSQQLQPRLVAAAGALSGARTAAAPAPAAADTATIGATAAGADTADTAAAVTALLDIRAQAAKCVKLFEETLESVAASPQESLWLQAGMYPVYETAARCAQLLATATARAAAEAAAAAAGPQPNEGQQQQQQQQAEGPEAAAAGGGLGVSEEYLTALSTCLRLQGVANAGSDMHVQLAARYDTACAAHAVQHPGPHATQLAADARQRLERALLARYGVAATSAATATSATATAAAAAAAAPAAAAAAAPSLDALLRVLRELQPPSAAPSL